MDGEWDESSGGWSAGDVAKMRAPLHAASSERDKLMFVQGVQEGRTLSSLMARMQSGGGQLREMLEEVEVVSAQTLQAQAEAPGLFQEPGARLVVEVDLVRPPTNAQGWIQSNHRRNVYHIFFFHRDKGTVGQGGRLPRVQSHVEAELPDWAAIERAGGIGAEHGDVGLVEIRSIMSGSTVNMLDRHQHMEMARTVDGHRLSQRCALVRASNDQVHVKGGEGHLRVFLEAPSPVPVLPVDCLESMSNVKEYTNAEFPGFVLESRPVCSVWTKSGGEESPLVMNPPYATWVLRHSSPAGADSGAMFARLTKVLAGLTGAREPVEGDGSGEVQQPGKRSKNV